MHIRISYDNPSPMYEQIEEAIKKAALSGELSDNQPLPSVRQLSADLQVSQITVKRAYADLEREGFIYTVSGRGTFVRLSDIKALGDIRQKEIMTEAEGTLKRAMEAGISKEQFTKLVEKVYGGRN